MLPDGADRHFEDWTIFFLNQTPFNKISPVLALETPEPSDDRSKEDGSRSELISVLNLVRTKHDKSVRRYGPVLLFSAAHSITYHQRCRSQSNGCMHAPPFHSDIQGL